MATQWLLIDRVTHVLVYTNEKKQASVTGVCAVMKLCFGEDTNAISQILWAKNGTTADYGFVLPNRPSVQQPKVMLPVFTGRIEQELIEMAKSIMGQIKKTKGKIIAGKTYRVCGDKVEEVARSK